MGNKDHLKSFSYEEYRSRIRKLQDEMKQTDIDMLLLSSPENILYSTGYRSWYTSSLFRPVLVMIPKEGEPAISLRILEKTTVKNTSWIENIYYSGSKDRNIGDTNSEDHIDGVKRFLDSIPFDVKKVGIESGAGMHFYWSLDILNELISTFSDINFIDGSQVIQKSRMIKSQWEINRIQTAGYITDRAIFETFKSIKPGVTTEKEISRGIAQRMTAEGIDKISYLTVNSGIDKYSTFNSYSTDRVVQFGEVVLVDISGHIDGYASDLTRTMYLGYEIPTDYLEMAETARNSIIAGFDAIKPGIPISKVSKAIENTIKDSKFGNYLIHSSGHSIGLNVVEFPMIENNENLLLEEGMIFALENGVYPFDISKGAETINMSFRLEDLVLVTKEGGRWLTGPGTSVYTLNNFL